MPPRKHWTDKPAKKQSKVKSLAPSVEAPKAVKKVSPIGLRKGAPSDREILKRLRGMIDYHFSQTPERDRD